MKQKSRSLRQLPTVAQASVNYAVPISSSYSALPPALNYNSRLLFPQVGDSRFYSDVGKKHYDNQSDRLLKIVLPQKYALENTLLRRERSIQPPHLQRQFSERHQMQSDSQSSANGKAQISRTPLSQNMKNRVEDQLDRMKAYFDKKTIKHSYQDKTSTPFQKALKIRNPTIAATENNLSSAPIQSSRSTAQNTHKLLYNPENKQIYDKFDLARSKNPTHLSTGLSII